MFTAAKVGTIPRKNRELSHGKIRFSDFRCFGGFLIFLWPFWDPGGFPKASQTRWDRFWLNMDPNGAMGTRFKPKTMIFCVSGTSELFRSETCALLTPQTCSLLRYEACSLLTYETCSLLTFETCSLWPPVWVTRPAVWVPVTFYTLCSF